MKIFALALMVVAVAFAGDAQENYGDYAGVRTAPGGGVGGWDYPMALLFDNGPFVTGVGTGSGGADVSEENPGETTYGWGVQLSAGNKMADQFVIPAGETWNIEALTVFGYQTNSGTSSTITGVYMVIYDGTPDSGTLVYGDGVTNVMSSTDWTNCYRCGNGDISSSARPIMANVCDFTPFSLGEGEYWIAWQLDGSGSSGPWANPVTIAGVGDTGDAMQYTDASGWLPIPMGGTGTPVGMPFILEGTIASALERSSWAGIKTSF